MLEPIAGWGDLPLWVGFAAEGTRPPAPSSLAPESAQSTAAGLASSILFEAGLMLRLRPDSLAVPIRPNARTEIILRLTDRSGTIEAEASYERGDLDSLRSAWPDLQHHLQLQGVRLLGLECPPELASAREDSNQVDSQDHPPFSASEVDCGALEAGAQAHHVSKALTSINL